MSIKDFSQAMELCNVSAREASAALITLHQAMLTPFTASDFEITTMREFDQRDYKIQPEQKASCKSPRNPPTWSAMSGAFNRNGRRK